ncbi:MAG TPA: glycerophosphodiester phosphodiesterase [Ktedonobacterales bacterium]|nr:glycerophosphodiester phosphodiesterase [Ktedonobacterales bacterium]
MNRDKRGATGREEISRPPYTTHERPLFFAHRGGSALAPENTLPAYERGLALGADALELDIHYTRDGEIVVFHDDMLERTTNGSGPISALTLDEIKRLDAGYRFTPDGGATYPWRGQGVTIPTLVEVFERFPDVRINIDIKQESEEGDRRFARLLRDHSREDRTMVGSFEEKMVARFRALSEGRVATSASAPEARSFVLHVLFRATRRLRPAYDALQVPEVHRGIRVVSPTSIRLARELGLDIHVWTVDNGADMERLLDWGVDGLMTDRPDTLAAIYQARGWLAASVEAVQSERAE